MKYEKEQKIDFVITWVDGNDSKWLEEKNKYKNNSNNTNYNLADNSINIMF